jgi:hypothetical protein
MESAPIIITANMGHADQAWANQLRRDHFPPERNFLDAHITLFQHLPPANLAEIKTRLSVMTREYAAPGAMLSDVMMLSRGVAYKIESPQLLAMRDELAHAFNGLLIPQDQARPRFHITIQNKVEPKVAKALYAEILEDFQPRAIHILGLSAYYYRVGPWEQIQSWSFRG